MRVTTRCEWCLVTFTYEKRGHPRYFCCDQHKQAMDYYRRTRREAGLDDGE